MPFCNNKRKSGSNSDCWMNIEWILMQNLRVNRVYGVRPLTQNTKPQIWRVYCVHEQI